MKRHTLKSVLFLFTLLAGVLASFASKAADVHLYDVNFQLNNQSLICAVYGLPQSDAIGANLQVLDYSVDVDGSGKITGFAQIQLSTPGSTSVVMANVSGSMGMKGTSPVVNMTIRGPGFGTSSGGNGKGKVNVKFTGTPSASYPSDSVESSYASYEMVGTVNGSFDAGLKGVKTVNIKNQQAYISSGDVEGFTQINSCILNLMDVNNVWTVGGCLVSGDGYYFHNEWNGKGAANWKGNFGVTLTGTGPMVGAKITLKGVAVDDTQNLDNVGGKVFTKLSATGKVMGQKVNATGTGYLAHRDIDNLAN